MKHLVAPQSRKASYVTFFCLVCSVTGTRTVLGVVVSVFRARVKANQLGVVDCDVVVVVKAFASQF